VQYFSPPTKFPLSQKVYEGPGFRLPPPWVADEAKGADLPYWNRPLPP
jgi:hypothetical protein